MGSLVRLLAIAASALIALSLLMFALDQSEEGTDTQLRSLKGQTAGAVRSPDEVNAPNPGPAAERVRESQNSSAREFVDDGNDLLASPFTGIVESKNLWVERLVPAVLGLLLFGLGGLMLANWLPQSRTEHHDWREAPN
jgi:hypothetical protein